MVVHRIGSWTLNHTTENGEVGDSTLVLLQIRSYDWPMTSQDSDLLKVVDHIFAGVAASILFIAALIFHASSSDSLWSALLRFPFLKRLFTSVGDDRTLLCRSSHFE